MTEQGRANREAEAGELFRLLAENMRDGALFVVGPRWEVLTWGQGAERLYGFSEREVVGRSADCLCTPEDVGAGVPQRELDEALAAGKGGGDRWQVRKDGSRFWAS